jgi:hypothetical protein
MNDNEDELIITKRDFMILVTPIFEDENWTGNVNIDVAYPKNHDLTKETYRGIDFFIRMMIGSLSIMQDNETLRETMYNYVAEDYPDEFEDLIEAVEDNKKSVKIEYGQDNVINLTFSSDTEGSA